MTRGDGYVLILTPLKNASPFLQTYFSALSRLSYPRELISLGFLESDSRDDTYELVARHAARLSGPGVMASDMGYECWGMPNLEILHYPD